MCGVLGGNETRMVRRAMGPYVGDNEDHHDDMTGYGRQRQRRFVESKAYIALPYLSIRAVSRRCKSEAKLTKSLQ